MSVVGSHTNLQTLPQAGRLRQPYIKSPANATPADETPIAVTPSAIRIARMNVSFPSGSTIIDQRSPISVLTNQSATAHQTDLHWSPASRHPQSRSLRGCSQTSCVNKD